MTIDKATQKEILETVQKHNAYLLHRIRMNHGVIPEKIRVAVWVEDAHLEAELKVDDKELFEADFQKWEDKQTLEEAKRILRDGT